MNTAERHLATRRTALGAAVWSVPAVTLATATPAFASSEGTPGALTYSARTLSTVSVPADGLLFYELEQGVTTLHVGGQPAPVAPLTMSVSLTPYPGLHPKSNHLFVKAVPAGWTTHQEGASWQSTIVFTYGGEMREGAQVVLPAGSYVGTDLDASDAAGVYVVTFAMSGFVAATHTVATPAAKPLVGKAARAARLDPESVLPRSERLDAVE